MGENKPVTAKQVGVVMAVSLSIVVVLAAFGITTDNGSSSGSKVGAEMACEDLIGGQLTSPGSADYTHQRVKEDGTQPGVWVVSGYVDSQNGFGALVRSDYVCTVEKVDGGWRKLTLAVI